MAENIIAGIDVGTTKVCTLIAELQGVGEYQILGFGVEPAQGMRKGVVVNVDEASAAIRASIEKAERTAGVEIPSAFISIAGSQVSSVNSNGVAGISQNQWGIGQTDIDRALDAAQAISIPHGRQIVHVIPRGFMVDQQEGVRSPLGMHGFRLEVEAHIITAASSSIQNLEKCIQNSGVQVEGQVLNPLASAEVTLTDTEREMGVILCDVGGGTIDLAIFIDGTVWHTMVLPIGGNHITNDIAHGLRLPVNVAEELKLKHGHARSRDIDPSETLTITPFGAENPQRISRKDLSLIIEARVEEIFSLVLQEIKRSGYDGLLPAGIVISGGTAHLPGLRTVASDIMRLPARVAGPTGLRGLTDQLEGKPEYATAVGLLAWAATDLLIDSQQRAANRAAAPPLNGAFGWLMTQVRDWWKRMTPG